MKLLVLGDDTGYDEGVVALVKLLQDKFEIEITELNGYAVLIELFPPGSLENEAEV